MLSKNFLWLLLQVFCIKCFSQGVNTKSGNFYISYSDMEFKEHPLDFQITRSYNSKAVEKGWFGMGWGSNYESRLYVIPGGGIVVYSWRKTAFEIFKPIQWNKQEIMNAVNKIAAIAQQKLVIKTPQEISKFKNKLLEDEDERINYWLTYLEEGLVEDLKIPAGSRLSPVVGGTSYVQVLDKGFKIQVQEGHTWFFDSKGRLEKLSNDKGDEIAFSYNEDGYPFMIRDNLKNTISLTFHEDGLVRHMIRTLANGKKDTSFYTYDHHTQTLLSSRDIENNYYEYQWDNDFYLIRVRYTDGSDTKISYDDNGLATSLKRKNGSKTLYTYPTLSHSEYGTTTTDFDSAGNQIKSYAEWYVIKTDDVGKEWEYKKIIVKNNDSVTYINSERFGLADTVYLNKGKFYTYQYDTRRNLTSIYANGSLLVQVVAKNDRLKEIIAAGERFRVVYKDDRVEKLITAKNEEIAIPLQNSGDDPSRVKAIIKEFLPAFKYTYFWYDLHFTD